MATAKYILHQVTSVMKTRYCGMAWVGALWLAPCLTASCSTILGISDVGPDNLLADGSAGDAAGGGGSSGDASHDTGGAAGTAGSAHGGAAGSAGTTQAGAAGSSGGANGGSAGASQGGAAGSDAGCVEGETCMAPGGWSVCQQLSVTSCVGQRSRVIGTCHLGTCEQSEELQSCNLPQDTKCGDDKCCGPGQDNYPGCGGKCGSVFFKLRCDASGTCKELCDHVVCWSSGCGAGTVTDIGCP